MVEVTKPDYLSLVNKSGSGFNVSELVTAIVASEIEPKRAIQNTKLEKTESAISGLGLLNSQAGTTKANFETILDDNFFAVKSSDENVLAVNIIDESQVTPTTVNLSNIQPAKAMVFELSGFDNLTDTFSADLQLEFGTWFDPAANNDFTAKSSAIQVSFAGKTLSEIASIFSDLEGISAKLIDKTGDGSDFSLVITGELTGAANGFSISATDNDVENDRWITPSNNLNMGLPNNQVMQFASDAQFEYNDVNITRASNTITDLIDGVEINLLNGYLGNVSVNLTRSPDTIRAHATDIVFSLNEFKNKIDELTFIDLDGNANGPLVLDPAVARIKSDFKKLAFEPMIGYFDQPIFLSQLGIKTNSDGKFYLDNTVFERTLRDTPEKFMALKDEFLSGSRSSVKIIKSAYTNIPAGVYNVQKDGNVWKVGDIEVTREDYNGGSRFTSTQYPGLAVYTPEVEPQSFNVYIGTSFSQRAVDLMDKLLDLNSSINRSEETYKIQSSDIQERLAKLEQREKLISERYTRDFGSMEQAMTQFNSTKTLLENFIEAWKKN